MNLSELIRKFRVAAFDNEQPYLFSDSDITDWLNDAVKEAAIRGRLIHESVNPDVCLIPVLPNISVYPMNEALYEIDHIRFVSVPASRRDACLYQISQEGMDDIWDDWRTRTGSPEYVIQGDTSLRLVPTPTSVGMVVLEGYRTPIEPMIIDTDRPEINIIHHEFLIHWALHKGFSVPDAETFDREKSELQEQKFTDYFGERPDSDLRRITREDTPHTVKPFWV